MCRSRLSRNNSRRRRSLFLWRRSIATVVAAALFDCISPEASDQLLDIAHHLVIPGRFSSETTVVSLVGRFDQDSGINDDVLSLPSDVPTNCFIQIQKEFQSIFSDSR